MPRKSASILLFFSIAACSSESTTTAPPPAEATQSDPVPSQDPPADDTTPVDPPPPKPSFPHVLSRGGPVVTAPKIVPIVFTGDTMATQIEDFTKKLSGSAYWAGVTKEYGVGALTAGQMITVDETPPANLSSTDIETWLTGKLTGTTPAFGAPDENTLYAIFYPAGTTIQMDGTDEGYGQSCQGYGGYHYELTADAKKVGYAVLPRCGDIDALTVATSHEAFEWATDPFPLSTPAFSKLDDEHWAWQATMIGELSDLCTFLDLDGLRPTELGYKVQRHWSNMQSLAGTYPCSPAKNVPYVQVIGFPTDDATVPDYALYNKYIHTKAIRVAPGKSRTVDMLVYSDRSISSSIGMRAMSWQEIYGGKSDSGFTFELEKGYAQVGDTVKLTITAPATANYDLLVLASGAVASGKWEGDVFYWPILVTNDGAGSAAVTPDTMPKKPAGARARYTSGTRMLTYSRFRYTSSGK